ncbi:DUF1642 domain-containing protein [Streptococcus suis]|uniref:Phage protein n=1 Tax=Streptococcus suis TaxID=1307 RepID=A0A116RAZ7_STRSU|nr:DUF1642 domain-containing protein [Streptococcus suis]NQR62934.1 DUF1642 domain-containing protein [Streptococcus suis]CYX58292.1 phage protein [Streptococcus suis]HEM4940512.1 DUF1642 domain-containing protein [Streptococcus suis]HEM5065736.1 DUF1642 domain-containing protein [Streptococcus suis]HEM6145039.1 DUF1642 domain-containing protein [Streptococcus suis]
MNKQELEKQAEALYTDVRSFLDNTFELIDQIDQPQKVVVPKVIDDYIKECRDGNVTLTQALFCLEYHKQEIGEWLNRNEETFARAWLDGYEVEKENSAGVPVL